MFTSNFNDYTLIGLQKEFCFPCHNLLQIGTDYFILYHNTFHMFVYAEQNYSCFYHNNKDHSRLMYNFKFCHSGLFLLVIAQLQKCL